MDDALTRTWEELIGRDGGPLHFRLFLQPAVSAFLAIRAGRQDSADGLPVYCWAIVKDSARRGELLRHGWNHVGKIFTLALILDVVYQVIVLRWVHPLQALIVAINLAVIPYAVIRGLTNFVVTSTRQGVMHEIKEPAKMVPEAVAKENAAPDQLSLAVERTYLANERTLMAWIRTATSLITFGFTLYKFFLYLHEQDPTRHVDHLLGARTFGLLMIGIGVFSLVLATVQHRQQMKRLRPLYPGAPQSLSLILAALIAALGILGFATALLRQ